MASRATKRSRHQRDIGIENIEPAAKCQKQDFDVYSKASQRMMAKMGFKPQSGLGKEEQGRRELIKLPTQQNRSGLGLKANETTANETTTNWNETLRAAIDLEQYPDWYYGRDVAKTRPSPLNGIQLLDWVQIGEQKTTIEDETHFCEAAVLKQILANKSKLDRLRAAELNDGRMRSNPAEIIGKSIFMNRAAVKLAHIESMTNAIFSNPEDIGGISLLDDNELLYFGDICAGPGGFSEYILWRKNWHAKGFGFTLKESCDFRLQDFLASNPESFHPHYGKEGDGNIYNPENIASYHSFVLENTNGLGLHTLMADGGFSASGKENIQEILSKQLYLCQCLIALYCVRENGHFLLKLFDTFTPFTVGLIFLMSECFSQITIVKPYTSRPASSERYLLCKWRLPNVQSVRDYLYTVNVFMWKNRMNKANKPNTDVLALVPIDVIKANREFYEYICQQNNAIGRNQAEALMKLATFSQKSWLNYAPQENLLRRALQSMYIPNAPRPVHAKVSIAQSFAELMGHWYGQREFMASRESHLDQRDKIPKLFTDISAWHFVPVQANQPTGQTMRAFFISRGNGEVYQYSNERNTWNLVESVRIELPRNTLVYAEIVTELCGEGRAQTHHKALHIIDGLVLGGEDIRTKPLGKRLQLCDKFARAIYHPGKMATNSEKKIALAPIRCKQLIPLANIRQFFAELKPYKMKDGKTRLCQPTSSGPTEMDRFYLPRGLLMFNVIKPNLRREYDQQYKCFYYSDLSQGNRRFYPSNLRNPELICGSVKSTFPSRQLWKWDLITQIQPQIDGARLDRLVYRTDLEQFIQHNVK